MSTTIDQRVVEMRFDNKHFEQNVSTTMSTLDKLKQKLHLDGAVKGLDNVNNAAKNVNMNGLGAGVEAVSAKFSALQVMGVTALANITNSAVNAGKRMIKALTLDPITTGFKEYETQINATQTILANTKSKGSTIDDVNKALEELNRYADLTIYNFTEMTRNIGTFTAAGVDLDTSVNAIQGIANLAAVSGSTSQQASTAMYQLSQALAAGTIRLMDWNSVVNAGMGGEVFQNALKETSRELGTGADAAIKATGSFRESLRQGWLTSEVLTQTLKKFTTSGANEYVAKYTGLSIEAIEAEVKKAQATGDSATAMDRAAEAIAKMSGKSKDAIKETLEFAQTATDAATKVKTFTQLWDVLKEAAQSGWAQTWKIIVGDFEEAKSLLTPLADFLTGIINKMSDWRNAILESALGKGLGAIGDNLNKLIQPASKAMDVVKDTADSLAKLDKIASKVIRGDFGNGQKRFDALTKAGINYCEVQNRVNERLGDGFRYTKEQIAAQDKLINKQKESTETTEAQSDATIKLNDEQKEQLKRFAAMGYAQAKSKGYTDEQIQAMKELGETAEKLGLPMDEFIDNLDQLNGRWLLINSFKNIGQGIVRVFTAMKDAWQEIFPPKSIEERGEQLFNIIAAFHKFTSILEGNSDTAEKFKRTFKGIFAILDVIRLVVGGPLKIAFDAIVHILSLFDLNILDVTAAIGDAAVKFRDWIKAGLDFSKILDPIVYGIMTIVEAWSSWIGKLKESENLPKDIAEGIASGFGKAFTAIKDFIKKIPEFIKNIPDMLSGIFDGGALPSWMYYFEVAGDTIVELGKIILKNINKFLNAKGFEGISSDAIAGLVNGLKSGATDAWNAAVEMASELVQKVKDFLGIHSPSTVFAAIGGFIIAGLIAGLQNGIPDSLGAIKDIFQPMLDWIKGLDFGAVMAAAFGIFSLNIGNKVANSVQSITSPFEGLGSIFEGTGEILQSTAKVIKKSARPIKKVINNTAKVVKSFSKVLDGVAFSIKVDAIKSLVETLLFLVGAIIVLTFFDPAELWNAVGIITVLALVLTGLAWALNKIGTASAEVDWKKGIDIKGISTGLTGIGIAIMLMAAAVKMMGTMNPEQAKQGFAGLAGLIVAVGVVLAVFGTLVKGKSAQNIDKFGKTMTKFGVALLLMAVVTKILGGLDRTALEQGIGAIAAFSIIIMGLIWSTELMADSKHVGTIGGTLVKMAVAIGLMAIVAKMLGEMDRGTLIQGGLAIVAFGGIIVGLIAATKLLAGRENKNIATVGSTLLKIGVAIGIMGLVVKMLGGMEPEEILRGTLAVTAFGGIIVGLMAATKLITGSTNVAKIGGALLAISGAIAIMAITAFMLSMISWDGFAKGTLMITAFAGIMVGLMAATKLLTGSKNVEKIGATLIAVAGAIGILALVAVLLGLVPVENLIKGTAVVAVLSGLMMGLIAVTKFAKNCLGNLIVLTVAIAVLAGAVYLLSTVDPTNLTGATVAMTVVVATFGLVIAASSLAGKAMDTLIVLTAAIAIIGIILYSLASLPVDSVLGAAVGLSAVLIAISIACVILGGIPVVAAANAALGLSAFIGIMALLLLALGGLSKIPGFNELIADGGHTLSLIGNALGAFVGSIVAGFAGQVLTILPMLGVALSGFMIGVQPFIAGVRQVDTDVLVGAGILTAAILALTVADFIAGITSLGGLGLIGLGAQLSGFILAAMPFITTAAMITPDMMAGVKSLAETILILTAADLLDGLKLFGGSSLASFASELPLLGRGLKGFSDSLGEFSEDQLATVNCAAKAVKTLAQASSEIPNAGGLLGMLVGENDLGTFASQFPVLGTGLRGFLDNVGEFTDAQVTTVNCAAQAIKTLAQASSEIPNSGGWLGQIVGENDLSTFASQFPVLGTGLRGFLDNVGEFTDTQVATVDSAAQAIKLLAEASSEIPNSGGWLAQIVGDNDLGTFAEQFPALGEGIRGFLDNAGDIDETAISAIKAGAEAVSVLAQAATNIPNEGGWISKIVGDNSLGTFASNFPTLGEGIAGFVEKLGTFTEAQVATVKAGVSAIRALSELASVNLSNANTYLTSFGSKLPGFALDLGSFCTNMPSSNAMSSVSSTIKTLLASVKDIGDANSGCLSTFADNLKKISEKAIEKFVGAFTSSTAKTDIKKAATTLGEKAVEGAESQKDEMKTAGKDLGKGLVKGIEDKYDDAYNAGFKLGQKAVQGEKDGQASNSPSKLTIKAGKWIGEGLVIGMGQMARKVYNAGYGLGDTATNTITSAVSRISDAINTDIDAQPTIRPVMDLSDVRAGTSAIGNMLNMGSTIGVRANIGSISSMMNSRSMAATNNDVVSAIDKLRKDLGNVGNTTYNVNGVTYDDGSNVSSAIQSLVRYATIERRV